MEIRDKKPNTQFFIRRKISSLRFYEKNRLPVVHKAMPFTAKNVRGKREGEIFKNPNISHAHPP